MKLFISILALFSFLFSCAQQIREDGIALPYGFKTPDSIKVLSWNVEHFVDTHDNPYINTKRENEPDQGLEKKINLFAKAIKKIDADVIVLQEFESAAYAQRLANDYFPEMKYEHFAAAESDGWYMNVVILSRLPMGVLYSYGRLSTPVPGSVNRDNNNATETQSYINTRMISVEILAGDYDFILTGLHLKAGGGDRNKNMRRGQYEFLQHQFMDFLKLDKKTNLLILGDFNSYPDSEELKEFLTEDKKLKLQNLSEGDTLLTHGWDEKQRQLDYIVVNKNMEDEYSENSLKIEMPLSDVEMETVSDHKPLSAVFRTKE